jgi:flagellar motor switch/type III secretory pathway protein FliN
MNGTVANNLSRDKIRQLLASIGSRLTTKTDTKDIKTTEYDWRQCRYFNTDELSQLNNLTKHTGAMLAEKFAELYHSNLNVTVISTTLHFASELITQISISGQYDYYLAFGTDQKNLFGLIGIPARTAVEWVGLLLGDVEPETESKKIASVPPNQSGNSAGSQIPSSRVLSNLEESILFDIASAVVEVFSTSLSVTDGSLRKNEAAGIQPAKTIVRGKLPIELQGTEEICKIVFNIEKADIADPNISEQISKETPSSGTQTYFLMPCSKLAPVVGKTVEDERRFSSEDISKAILNHLQEMPVSVIAVLASTTLTLEQIISLRPSDLLLLDKTIDEPAELIVDGRAILHGLPVKSAGQYAVAITELSKNAEKKVKPDRDA